MIEDPKRCPQPHCAHKAANPHPCPYQSDVNNNDEFQCECCEECTEECAADI